MDNRDEGDARSRVQSQLLPDERVVWIGAPDPRVNFTSADAALIPIGLGYLGLGIFFLIATVGDRLSALFDLVFVVYILIGLYYLLGRFIYKRWDKRRTVYAITNERALVLIGPRNTRAISIRGQTVDTKRARNSRHESITFDPPEAFGLFSNRNRWPNTGRVFLPFMTLPPIAFYDVADVDGLEAALFHAQTPPKDRIANA